MVINKRTDEAQCHCRPPLPTVERLHSCFGPRPLEGPDNHLLLWLLIAKLPPYAGVFAATQTLIKLNVTKTTKTHQCPPVVISVTLPLRHAAQSPGHQPGLLPGVHSGWESSSVLMRHHGHKTTKGMIKLRTPGCKVKV